MSAQPQKLPGKLLSLGFERRIRAALPAAESSGRRRRRTAGYEPDPKRPPVPVRLEAPGTGVDGGADGDGTTQASWKYVVKDLAGNVLLKSDTTPVAPEMQRENGSKQRAKIGELVYDGKNRAWKLWWCDEADSTTGNCNT